MFYHAESKNRGNVYSLISLAPSESKRLIAKGAVALPEIKRALKQGTVVVTRGTTDAYIAEELSGQKIEPKYTYTAGIMTEGELAVTAPALRRKVMIFKKGQMSEVEDPNKDLGEFGPDDVYVKGANALDADGNCGVLVSGAGGGTIGVSTGMLQWRDAFVLAPIGLEKLVPSIDAAKLVCGINRFKYSTGLPVSMVVIPNAQVFTEIEALQVLFGVDAVMVGAGGIGGSEGCVVLSVSATADATEQMMKLIKTIKGEPGDTGAGARGNPPARQFDYDPKAQAASLMKR